MTNAPHSTRHPMLSGSVVRCLAAIFTAGLSLLACGAPTERQTREPAPPDPLQACLSQHDQQSIPSCERACADGEPKACIELLARQLRGTPGVERDVANAVMELTAWCARGMGSACRLMGEFTLSTGQRDQAKEWLRMGCPDDAGACRGLATLDYSQLQYPDSQLAGCQSGAARFCRRRTSDEYSCQAGDFYSCEKKLPADPLDPLYRDYCERGYQSACMQRTLGSLHARASKSESASLPVASYRYLENAVQLQNVVDAVHLPGDSPATLLVSQDTIQVIDNATGDTIDTFDVHADDEAHGVETITEEWVVIRFGSQYRSVNRQSWQVESQNAGWLIPPGRQHRVAKRAKELYLKRDEGRTSDDAYQNPVAAFRLLSHTDAKQFFNTGSEIFPAADLQSLAVTSEKGVWWYSLESESWLARANFDDDSGATVIDSSLDGKSVLVTIRDADSGVTGHALAAVSPEGTRILVPDIHPTSVEPLEKQPALVVSSASRGLVLVDRSTLQTTPVTTGDHDLSPEQLRSASATTASNLWALGDAAGNIVLFQDNEARLSLRVSWSVKHLDLSPDGTVLNATTFSGAHYRWAIGELEQEPTLELGPPHTGPVDLRDAWWIDDSTVAVIGDDASLWLWNPGKGDLVAQPLGLEGPVDLLVGPQSLGIAGTETQHHKRGTGELVVLDDAGSIAHRITDLPFRPRPNSPRLKTPLKSTARLISLEQDMLREHPAVEHLQPPYPHFADARLSPDGELLAMGRFSVWLMNLDGQVRSVLPTGWNSITSLAFLDSDQLLVNNGVELSLWDLDGAHILWSVPSCGHALTVSSVESSSRTTNHWIATSGRFDGLPTRPSPAIKEAACLHRPDTGELHAVPSLESWDAARISPDGNRLLLLREKSGMSQGAISVVELPKP